MSLSTFNFRAKAGASVPARPRAFQGVRPPPARRGRRCPTKICGSNAKAGEGGCAGRLAAALLRSLLFCLALALCSCGTKTAPSNVLAKVGDTEITVQDFAREIDRLRAARRPIPPKDELLKQMVEFQSLVQKARKLGLDTDPGTRREIDSLLIGKLQERELSSQLSALEVTAEEIGAEYQQSISKYTRPAKVRLAILFQELPPVCTEARKAAARDRLSEAAGKFHAQTTSLSRATPGFGPLALDYSDDQLTRYRGGDLGWLDETSGDDRAGRMPAPPARLPAEVLQAGFALSTGEISPVVGTAEGLYMIMKTDYRESSVVPLAQVEQVIRQSLLSAKRESMRQAWLEGAIKQTGAQINRELLDSVEVSAASLAADGGRESAPPAFAATTQTRVQ